jgi:hypothetical protein
MLQVELLQPCFCCQLADVLQERNKSSSKDSRMLLLMPGKTRQVAFGAPKRGLQPSLDLKEGQPLRESDSPQMME